MISGRIHREIPEKFLGENFGKIQRKILGVLKIIQKQAPYRIFRAIALEIRKKLNGTWKIPRLIAALVDILERILEGNSVKNNRKFSKTFPGFWKEFQKNPGEEIWLDSKECDP